MNGRVAFLLAAAVALTMSCAKQTVTHPPVAVALIDGSTSDASPAIAARYLADLRLLVTWVAQRSGLLYADVAGPDALATATVPVAVDFTPGTSIPNNPLYEQINTTQKTKQAEQQSEAMFAAVREHPANQSDIVSAVVAAARLFAVRDGVRQRFLVVESDMTQYGGVAGNFYTDDLSNDAIQRKIVNLRDAGLVPDLKSVTVLVDGAGVASDGRVEQTRILAIERFWRAYFAAAGATLPPGGYGARLVALPA